MAIKCADLSHTTTDQHQHVHWVNLLKKELWDQGDQELLHDLSISPLTDRAKHGLMNSQKGFFDVFVLPMYDSLTNIFPDCKPLLDGARRNLDCWKTIS